MKRLIVQVDGSAMFVIARDDTPIRRSDHGAVVVVEGEVTEFAGSIEVHAKNITVVSQAARNRKEADNLAKSNECLAVRHEVISSIHAHFRERGFNPTQSPSIVGDWVIGDTQAFEVDFYGTKRYLSISNMIYHQMLICDGFNRIYEVGKLHRHETPSGRRKLAEFTILDISMACSNIQAVMHEFEAAITVIHQAILKRSGKHLRPVESPPEFRTISYAELLEKSEVKSFSGSQLPVACRRYLAENFESFVWVTGFDVDKRPMYTKQDNGMSLDCQLWYQGRNYLVAGSEIETSPVALTQLILGKGSIPQRYSEYLDKVVRGAPAMAMAGMGIERLLSLLTHDSAAADFVQRPTHQTATIF